MRNKADYRKAGIPMLPAVVGEDTAVKAMIASTLILPAYIFLFYFLGVVNIATLLPALGTGLFLLYLTLGIPRDSRAAWPAYKFSGVFLPVTLLAVASSAFLI